MNRITTNIAYGALAITAVMVMVFTVLPQLPNINSQVEKLSLKADSVLAWGDWGGSGDYGGGCCSGDGGMNSVDHAAPTPQGWTSDWGDWGGTGDYGAGCCDSGGYTPDTPSGGGDYTPPPPPPPAAKCDFLTVSPTTLPYGGGTVTVSWGTTNATSVSISGIGSVGADGSTSVSVNGTKTFTLTAVGAGGNDTCTGKVTVQPPPVAKCDFLKANKTTVPYGGGNVTLTWGTTNATNVSISGVGSGLAADGSTTVNVTGNQTFTLTATGAGGNDTCTVSIKTQPKKEAAVCHYLTASPTSLPYNGGNVTLTWETTNATNVTLNGETVSADGNKTVFVGSATTFTLNAVGAGGNDSCVAKVELRDKPQAKAPKCDFFHVSDDEVEKGDRVTLSWGTTNADDVYINNGIGFVSDDGDTSVRIDRDITYTLTVTNAGKQDTCKVSIEVEEEDDKNLRCDLEISHKKVKKGDKVTIEWDVRDADEFTIEDDRGNTIHRDRNPGSRERGEEEVRITRDTEFILIAEGEGSRDKKCRVEVEVEDEEVLVLTERDQGKVAGISLTQVPYTGFEAGTALTFLFYALLAAWAAFVAYTLVIKRDSILGFSLAGATVEDTPAPSYKPETEAYVASAPAVAEAPLNLPIGTPVYGYASLPREDETEIEPSDDLKTLEDRAHEQRVLFSSDAFRYFAAQTKDEDQLAALDALIASARTTYPSEDGWLVMNLARVEELMGVPAYAPEVARAEAAPEVTGSLAEAIVMGNLAAAYKLIEHRPMIALANATTEFDAIYRMYQGQPTENVIVSDLLKSETAKHSPSALAAAIEALTSALDGVYTDEASAVKMAIMKAVKAFN